MYQELMPNFKKQDKCWEDEQIEVVDSFHKNPIIKKDGKQLVAAFPHDKPVNQIAYEEFLKVIVNPDTQDYYPARNKAGAEIKGTGAKHIVNQIIRLRRKDGTEFLYSLGRIQGYDAFGNSVHRNCAKPEVWTRQLFDYKRLYDQRTNTTKTVTVGTLGAEDVYELPFNEKNLKELFAKRESDTQISFSVKDEAEDRAVSLLREPSINDTLKLFLKPFQYLYKAEYISKEQRAAIRQASIDAGIIAPNTPLVDDTEPAPPKEGTYS